MTTNLAELVGRPPTLNGMKWMSSDGTWVVELIHRTNSNGRDGTGCSSATTASRSARPATGTALHAWASISGTSERLA